ncbi:hypothetical protein APHAL10511_008255 [Amanita phalloides]|nr:hypothetical protein APHAL10511_008255 [Amanita phalloides]
MMASIPSWQPGFIPDSPPHVSYPYHPEGALSDLPGVHYALEVFLNSQMLESEQYCHSSDENKERLYFATGYGLIQCIKALMSYADEDLLAGLEHTRHGNHVASQHRKKQSFLGSRLAGYVVSALHSPVSFIRSMTEVERHAELVYAESLFEKSILGIVYSGDWLAFIKEALNMRTMISVYRHLGQYLDTMDAEARERGEPEDTSIDPHFRSGVYLGVGMSNIILSLVPGKLQTLVELFGYKGDRQLGLKLLMKAGGWSNDSDEPSVSAQSEGVRRSICDMALLIFHLVLSSITFEGVDISIAQKVLDWNLKRYPNGVFFLFGAGRISLCHSQPRRAIAYYTRAMESQSQYRNLHHVSIWEIGLAQLALWEPQESLACWKVLEKESTWSKSIYTYGMAVCLLESCGTDEKQREEAIRAMQRVQGLRQKIAGKSIPLEKLVARKARKFLSQKNRLMLPGLELAYTFLAISHAPRQVIIHRMLPDVYRALDKLERYSNTDVDVGEKARKSGSVGGEKEKKDGGKLRVNEYETNGIGYWDDYCLAKFLEGVCWRYVAYPDPDAEIDPNEVVSIPREEAETRCAAAFQFVFENGPKIELDHHIVYHAHYEYGRLLRCQGSMAEARGEFELVLSGKTLEVGLSGRKGRYSMENALHIRSHAALEDLNKQQRT